MLELTQLTKTFFPGTPNEVRALRHVSLTLERGSFLIIIGTNGSGKSTLLNAVAGTFFVDSGKVNLAGRNITRWLSAEFDKLYEASDNEIDPVKRAAMFVAMNDLLIKNVVVIPVVARMSVSAVASSLHAPLSGWDNNTYALQDWYRDA